MINDAEHIAFDLAKNEKDFFFRSFIFQSCSETLPAANGKKQNTNGSTKSWKNYEFWKNKIANVGHGARTK